MKRHLFRLVSVLACLGLLFAPISGVVRSAPAVLVLSVTPATAAQGTLVQVKATGFLAMGSRSFGELFLDHPNNIDGTYLGRSALDSHNNLLFDVLIPPGAVVGTHTLLAVVTNPADNITSTAQGPVTVTASKRKAALITGLKPAVDASFKTLLDANGISTTLIGYDTIGANTSFKGYDLVIIGPDTGNLKNWGSKAAVSALAKFAKPILGIGDGGYSYFGTGGRNENLKIGYGAGAHGAGTQVIPAAPTAEPFKQPFGVSGSPMSLFLQSSATVEFYYPQNDGSFFSFATDPQNASYHVLIQQGRFFEWGFDGQADTMTIDGKHLFVNFAWYLMTILSRDTLVVSNVPRMLTLGYTAADTTDLHAHLTDLVGRPASTSNMNAVWVDLSVDAPAGVQSNLTSWAANLGSVSWTNTTVNSIDAYLENLKHAAYPNLKYFILIGSHETIPMYARAVDNYNETSWGAPAGYLRDLYHSTVGGASNGYYLTDQVYSDLSYINNGWGADNVLVPDMSVGRMVETPAQISASIDTYLASSASLSRTNLAAIGSQDYMDGASFAAAAMGPTADTSLIQNGFNSSLVPPLLNSKHSIVYIGGHGDYNWMTTSEWGQGFMAGSTSTQGDTEELTNLVNAVIAAAGCHNGVVFPNMTYHNYDGTTNYGEFPERLANKQVGVYAAATGFTWVSISGSSTNVADTMYSEKVTALFIQHLMKDGFTTAGKAFTAAVNEYINERGKDALGNSLLDGGDRRAISIFTFYGIPNYRFTAIRIPIAVKFGYFLNLSMLALGVQSANSVQQVTQQVTLNVNNYKVESNGTVTIPGAAYSGDSDHPVLPVITTTLSFPAAPTGLSIVWNQAASTVTTITNDVPAAKAGVINPPPNGTGIPFIQPNNMTFSGFYPAELLYSTTTSPLGGGGTDLTLGIMPVQYNRITHQTKIWTHLVFNVSYTSDVTLNSADSDGDGLPDWWEIANGLNPFDATGLNGAAGDPDHDLLSNLKEYQNGTDPMNPDTDADGYLDGVEVQHSTNPLNPGSHPNFNFLPSVHK